MAEQPLKKSLSMADAQPRERPSSPEFEQLLKWKRDGVKIHWQLIDGSAVIGKLQWFDRYTVGVRTDDLGDIVICKHGLLWYREALEP